MRTLSSHPALIPFACALLVRSAPLSSQSTYKQVKPRSCALADSLLGPMAGDSEAVVRVSYWENIDSTRLIAGAERTHTYAGYGRETITSVLYTTSYGGHHPTVYPHLDLDFLISTRGLDPIGRAGDTLPVTLIVDGSSMSFGVVKLAPVAVGSGSVEAFNLRLSPNHSLVLAEATSAVFTIGQVSSTVTPQDLRDVRGMYRLAICGTGPSAGDSTGLPPFHVPATVGAATLQDSTVVGGATAYRYTGPQVKAFDLFIWSSSLSSASGQDSALREEVAKYQSVVPTGVDSGWYDTYKIVFSDPHPVKVDHRSIPGYVVSVVLKRGAENYVSFFYIYALDGRLAKIRLTLPGEGWGANPAMEWPNMLMTALARGAAGH